MSHVQQKTSKKEIKKSRTINVYVLLLIVLLVATVFTHIIPAGEYARIDFNGREIVDSDSFKYVDKSPASFFDFFKAIHSGMVSAADIIFFVLIIGGAFGVLTATGTIETLMVVVSRKLANKEKWLIPVMMLFFALGGSLMGMSEETLVYIPILIPLAIALGFDVLTGAAIVLIGASIGFTTAIMNPFTVGIAQGIAGLPIFSGMMYRIILFILMYAIAVWFVYRHAMKVKRDRSLGYFADYQTIGLENIIDSNIVLEKKHKLVLGYFLFNFVVLVIGVIKFQWYITEIASLFILSGIIMGILGKLSSDQIVQSFMNGAAGLITGALVIGVSRATLIVLEHGHIIDTILYHTSSALQHVPPVFSSAGMFILQSFIHFVVPSGSGQAALTMPIMAPLADLLGVTRQTAVLSFSMADGIGNIIFPTSGYFMAALSLAKIPWSRWAKWVWPLILVQYGIGIISVIIAQIIKYGPY
ncbi:MULTISPECIES: YfcC family protein [unclassified Lysinibacillus]|uniref:YfcC family protein n=1 Tax=unclassified Lysinibacillus TaxID=2636778 RepID=UPI003825BB52